MSDLATHAHDDAHAHGDHDHLEVGIPHVSAKEYLTGFVLSVVLTAIPFWLVMAKVLPTPAITTLVILAFAVVQVVVHMVYFLHMNPKSEGGWNLLALVFTLVLVVIVLAGSLWVMHHLNTNMMPGAHDMQEMLLQNAP
ncbi:cytochrome o ubiquinol oxidase subunit IV [Luteimonas aestuarii]|uniref:Cytochrome bo(3) ubiquinol oxidase subunit 4 n=1 Tax=Luteimonas aestuarii TaxID=453837 RepID=A0A4R5TYG2_9GAMM|nr:cytochrome o ubiquinol oxidase subunit IV [Luteimonas aestuarii]TDK26243.1 cytochrome o ubiquinol oxidase subunit IV [Luteimonas aestuarii]